MGSREMKPSNIFYSQDSINDRFRRRSNHGGVNIGTTLDNLCKGSIRVEALPRIEVTQRPGDDRFFTLDNRRLWLFHHLEAAGKCKTITVDVVPYEPSRHDRKFTGNGSKVIVRGHVEGIWSKKIVPVTPQKESKNKVNDNNKSDAKIKTESISSFGKAGDTVSTIPITEDVKNTTANQSNFDTVMNIKVTSPTTSNTSCSENILECKNLQVGLNSFKDSFTKCTFQSHLITPTILKIENRKINRANARRQRSELPYFNRLKRLHIYYEEDSSDGDEDAFDEYIDDDGYNADDGYDDESDVESKELHYPDCGDLIKHAEDSGEDTASNDVFHHDREDHSLIYNDEFSPDEIPIPWKRYLQFEGIDVDQEPVEDSSEYDTDESSESTDEVDNSTH